MDETRHPKSVRIYGALKFPNDGITFHASPSVGGKPWFDYGWISVDNQQPGRESDPFTPNAKRLLVKFWGFPEVNGQIYAIVTYHQKASSSPHPLLQSYKHLHQIRRGQVVWPLYAVKPENIIAAAVVFPDPDNDKQVLYTPRL